MRMNLPINAPTMPVFCQNELMEDVNSSSPFRANLMTSSFPPNKKAVSISSFKRICSNRSTSSLSPSLRFSSSSQVLNFSERTRICSTRVSESSSACITWWWDGIKINQSRNLIKRCLLPQRWWTNSSGLIKQQRNTHTHTVYTHTNAPAGRFFSFCYTRSKNWNFFLGNCS